MAMTPIVTLAVKPETLDRAMRELGDVPQDVLRAVTAAVNDTARKAKTRVVRAIAEEVSITQKDITKEIAVQSATFSKPFARLVITGKRISLLAFKARQNRKGVSYRIGKKGRTFAPHAFIATMRSGHQGVFVRKSGGTVDKGKSSGLVKRGPVRVRTLTKSGLVQRLPISELRGPSVVGVYQGAQGLAEKVLADTMQDLDARVNSKIDWLISRRSLRTAAA